MGLKPCIQPCQASDMAAPCKLECGPSSRPDLKEHCNDFSKNAQLVYDTAQPTKVSRCCFELPFSRLQTIPSKRRFARMPIEEQKISISIDILAFNISSKLADINALAGLNITALTRFIPQTRFLHEQEAQDLVIL